MGLAVRLSPGEVAGPEKSSGIILEDFESQFHLRPNASQTFLRARPTITDPGPASGRSTLMVLLICQTLWRT